MLWCTTVSPHNGEFMDKLWQTVIKKEGGIEFEESSFVEDHANNKNTKVVPGAEDRNHAT
jgi:hypothetical protein